MSHLPGARIVNSTARANIPHTHPKHGLQTSCGGECDECLALAGASPRPRQPAHARAAARYFGATDEVAVVLIARHIPAGT
eukprot:3670831-Pyramimonas_sp.AAC.1